MSELPPPQNNSQHRQEGVTGNTACPAIHFPGNKPASAASSPIQFLAV